MIQNFQGRSVPDLVRFSSHHAGWDPNNLHDDLLLRGAIVNRTYGKHKNLYIYPFLLTIFCPIFYAPPQYYCSTYAPGGSVLRNKQILPRPLSAADEELYYLQLTDQMDHDLSYCSKV